MMIANNDERLDRQRWLALAPVAVPDPRDTMTVWITSCPVLPVIWCQFLRRIRKDDRARGSQSSLVVGHYLYSCVAIVTGDRSSGDVPSSPGVLWALVSM